MRYFYYLQHIDRKLMFILINGPKKNAPDFVHSFFCPDFVHYVDLLGKKFLLFEVGTSWDIFTICSILVVN